MGTINLAIMIFLFLFCLCYSLNLRTVEEGKGLHKSKFQHFSDSIPEDKVQVTR